MDVQGPYQPLVEPLMCTKPNVYGYTTQSFIIRLNSYIITIIIIYTTIINNKNE